MCASTGAGILDEMRSFKLIVCLFSLLAPWFLRRLIYINFFGFELHRTARIGLSIVFPDILRMGAGARIGHLSVIRGLSLLEMGDHAHIGNLNWITAFPLSNGAHFSGEVDRAPELLVARHAAITNRHIIDCTNRVTIGAFSTVGGFRSQLLTHSIDISEGIQRSRPIQIGEFSFTSTSVVLLGGSSLPSFSVLAACAVLHEQHSKQFALYAGVPARLVKDLDPRCKYFTRSKGFVR